MPSNKVRVRFAPSPTGYLHVGGARTALYVYLFAKKNNGDFILRIEDTDEARSTEENLRMQIEDLLWLGLTWDEGPNPKDLKDMGEHGPYRQSQRLDIYKKYADELLQKGLAYYCFLTDEEIELQKEETAKNKQPPQLKSPYRDLNLEEAQKKLQAGEKATMRFKTPKTNKIYKMNDGVRGEVNFPSDMVGDFVLLRSSGMPVYNFCCVIDDFLMKISHVFRAEEHLSNSLRQMMIYEALNWALPEFVHLSLILGEDRQKLSKRHGAVSVGNFRKDGYLPEALINFLSLLGWSSPDGKEILSSNELIQNFSIKRLHSAGAVFDEKKLRWMNAHYLRTMDHKKLWLLLTPLFEKEKMKLSDDESWQDRALSVFKTSMEVLTDALDLFRPLDKNSFCLSDESKEVLTWETTPRVIQKWIELVSDAPQMEDSLKGCLSEEQFLNIQNEIKKQCSVKGKQLFMPIRVAIIGKPHGAELKQLVPLMPKDNLLDRAKTLV